MLGLADNVLRRNIYVIAKGSDGVMTGNAAFADRFLSVDFNENIYTEEQLILTAAECGRLNCSG